MQEILNSKVDSLKSEQGKNMSEIKGEIAGLKSMMEKMMQKEWTAINDWISKVVLINASGRRALNFSWL